MSTRIVKIVRAAAVREIELRRHGRTVVLAERKSACHECKIYPMQVVPQLCNGGMIERQV